MKEGTLFSFRPLVHRIIVIAIVIGIYYWLLTKGLVPEWVTYGLYAIKVIIAYEILVGSFKSIYAPILGAICGIAMLVFCQGYDYSSLFLSTTNGWELMIVSLVGALITITKL